MKYAQSGTSPEESAGLHDSGIAGTLFTDEMELSDSSPVDCFINLTPVDRHFLGGLDAKPYLVPANLNNDDSNIVVDDNAFVFLAR